MTITSFSSVQFGCSVVSDSLWPQESQHARPPCPSPTSNFLKQSTDHSQSTDTEHLHHIRISALSFHWLHWFILYFYNFIISRTLYKWDHTVCNVLRFFFFLSPHNTLEIHPSCYKHQECLPFYCWVIFHCVDVPQLVYPFTSWRTSGLFCYYE